VRRPRLIGEDLFKSVLIRERKRADRANQPLMLLLVTLRDQASSNLSELWLRVVDGLAAAKRETDILGWFKDQSAVGLIIPEIPASHATFVDDFAARLRCELEKRLDIAERQRLSTNFHVYPGLSSPVPNVLHPIDPLLGSNRGPKAYDSVKRGLDVIGSFSLLVLLSPLFLIIAVLVKLKSPGPVFFRQVRVGQNGKTFTCFKFRTMHVNADHAIHQQFVSSFIKSGPQAQEAVRGGVFKITDDPRVTAVGRFLRKSSLDELPQLWNVLRGEMSLVGPRPPVPYEVEQYRYWHCRRVLEAKPGITGLWQVNGRSRTTFDDMVRLDLRYARGRSLWTDLKILLATPKAVIEGKGAC
jgi:lipopolysaccharide/colanic/teichoic acid biosynthesis glycosyltransferase